MYQNDKKIFIPGTSQEAGPKRIVLPSGQELILGQEASPKTASPEIQAEVVGIPELASKYNILEKSLRARLRKLGLKKAGPKWAWPPGHPELDLIDSLFKK